jgi:hypothetical protein
MFLSCCFGTFIDSLDVVKRLVLSEMINFGDRRVKKGSWATSALRVLANTTFHIYLCQEVCTASVYLSMCNWTRCVSRPLRRHYHWWKVKKQVMHNSEKGKCTHSGLRGRAFFPRLIMAAHFCDLVVSRAFLEHCVVPLAS